MNPATVPDTRNIEWSPLKSVDLLLQRQQSGQLQYALSGFLSLQLEVQGFLLGDAAAAPADLLGGSALSLLAAPFAEVRTAIFSLQTIIFCALLSRIRHASIRPLH